MGKGDKKTKKGKIAKGSYGKLRPRKTQEQLVPAGENKESAKKK